MRGKNPKQMKNTTWTNTLALSKIFNIIRLNRLFLSSVSEKPILKTIPITKMY